MPLRFDGHSILIRDNKKGVIPISLSFFRFGISHAERSRLRSTLGIPPNQYSGLISGVLSPKFGRLFSENGETRAHPADGLTAVKLCIP
jgi:hypothetical protein